MHLVLDDGKKPARHIRVRVIVDARGVDIEHLAPKNLFRGANIPNACQQFIEIVAPARLFEPIVVQGKTFDDVLPQPLGGPYTELGAAMGFDPVTHGNDDIQIIEIDIP